VISYQDADAIVLQLFGCIRRLTDTHYVKHLVLLQLLPNSTINAPHHHLAALHSMMRLIVTAVAWPVYLLVTTVSCARTTKSDAVWGMDLGGPKESCSRWGLDPPGEF